MTRSFFVPVAANRAITWSVLASAKAGFFSGVGYHFARTIQPAIGVTLPAGASTGVIELRPAFRLRIRTSTSSNRNALR